MKSCKYGIIKAMLLSCAMGQAVQMAGGPKCTPVAHPDCAGTSNMVAGQFGERLRQDVKWAGGNGFQ